jgi:hypothetical protein
MCADPDQSYRNEPISLSICLYVLFLRQAYTYQSTLKWITLLEGKVGLKWQRDVFQARGTQRRRETSYSVQERLSELRLLLLEFQQSRSTVLFMFILFVGLLCCVLPRCTVLCTIVDLIKCILMCHSWHRRRRVIIIVSALSRSSLITIYCNVVVALAFQI